MTQDVVIAGGGVSGLSIALHLRLLGIRNVTVLERHHTGAGQSGRAAGIVRALVNSSAVASILMASLRFFRGFQERFGENIGVRETGYLLVNGVEEEMAMNSSIGKAATSGCRATRVSSAEASELQPGLRSSEDDIYAFEPEAIYVDAMLATHVLARVARHMGVRIEEGCEVQSILTDGSLVRGVRARSGDFLADRVVVATSVWGIAQLARLGIEVPVFPHRAEMAFFSVLPDSRIRLRRILSDARTLLYMRPEGVDQMFVGWREGDRVASTAGTTTDPDNYRQTSNYESLEDMRGRLTATLPFLLADGFVHRTYACIYDYTPDGMPILDQAEGLKGLYFALGFSGGGFSLSPWVGSAMARLIMESEKTPELQMLRLARFREGETLSWSNAAVGNRHA